jgi:hypothetical protein
MRECRETAPASACSVGAGRICRLADEHSPTGFVDCASNADGRPRATSG